MLKVTVLVENSVRKHSLLAEHGLSLWLECDDSQILFDAGQSAAWLKNAAQLGIDIRTADRLVLSHGHYDHGNGFRFFPVAEAGGWPRLFVHPDALARRFALQPSGREPRPIGLDWQPQDLPGLEQRLMLNTGTVDVAFDTCLCSHIADQVSGDDVSAGFLIEKSGRLTADRFLDEQILISRQKKGLVIICGCCHPGLLGTLTCVRQLYPDDPIHAVLGGFHLGQTTDPQMDALISSLEAIHFDWLIPMHCTGIQAWCRLHEAFPDRCRLLQTGDTIEF